MKKGVRHLLFLLALGFIVYLFIVAMSREGFAIRCGQGITFENSVGVCKSKRKPYLNNTCPPGYYLRPYSKWCWKN
jgi:hypothetical protein